jgi:hypothetical protein
MAAKLSRLALLSSQEWRWLCWSLALLPAAALSIRRSGWIATMERVRAVSGRDGKQSSVDPAALARMVRVAATYGPFRAKCLPRSLVLWALLRRHGFDPELKIGVRNGERGFEAHAWVELEGVALDQHADDRSFIPLRPQSAALES